MGWLIFGFLGLFLFYLVVWVLLFFFCFFPLPLCKAKIYLQSLARDFGQKYYYSFCPTYLAKLIWSFVCYASWKKKLAVKSGFFGKVCLFTRMYQVLLSVVPQGAHSQNWFLYPSLHLDCSEHPHARNPLPGLPSAGSSSWLVSAPLSISFSMLSRFLPLLFGCHLHIEKGFLSNSELTFTLTTVMRVASSFCRSS